MKKFKLSTQVVILFTTVTTISSIIFGYISWHNYQTVYVGLARNEVQTYLEANTVLPKDKEDYLGYILITVNRISTFRADVTNRIVSPNADRILNSDLQRINNIIEAAYLGEKIFKDKSGIYYVDIEKRNEVDPDTSEYMIAVMDNSYIDSIKASTMRYEVLTTFIGTFLSFAIIVFVGNTVIAMWSRKTAARIRYIQKEVSTFNSSGYENKVILDGEDEISELARSVEDLRLEIKENEKTKQEMFQNISHDLKTPISVIQSYAEAMMDGTTDISDMKIIIKQTEKLQSKVRLLLELNKINNIEMNHVLEEVNIKDIIINVTSNNKHRFGDVKVITDLDNSKFIGVKEYFYTSIENLIDNAIRYAKTEIVITLKNGTLTFFNDGPAIEEKYIKEGFKPYEKGSKGQFGIGMSIVQKTFNRFGFSLTVENVDNGVKFTIKKL
ncbi:HAMP domain-containing histidine kinase [Acholeplasma vituli]|uniref:histidine kinase n=1 Tax=Paracholeplasma vituli TaxID=69473 RepID=A0ABT2PTC3_9MOLU|nr:HAMP domain-containing sensor histidine kinase [Paracholeplasma vituli]MCU0104199.1 HAMP domain-containing histidine kinase [Paracholeplasma vituli]